MNECKKLVIRADSVSDIGTGHLMRCLALAQAWQDKGGRAIVITFCDSDRMFKRIKRENIELYQLKQKTDLRETMSIIIDESPSWVVLDGYHFDSGYHKSIKNCGCKLLVIDDHAHLESYCADAILNQNYGAERFKYNTELQTLFFLGTDYALIRKGFLRFAGYKKDIPDKAQNILITMGGSDIENHTSWTLRALNDIDTSLFAKVPVGASNPHMHSVRKLAESSKHQVEILDAPEEMADLMRWADIAVSAGGTTVWELFFMGVPSLLGITADNQENIVNTLSIRGFALSLGWLDVHKPDALSFIISEMIRDQHLRKKLSEKSTSVVDGLGAKRVSDILWQ
jgi:UDP-2,4-diacetamido-2,4,6-trideoxy-beta-L-altropyranose hydrolase